MINFFLVHYHLYILASILVFFHIITHFTILFYTVHFSNHSVFFNVISVIIIEVYLSFQRCGKGQY